MIKKSIIHILLFSIFCFQLQAQITEENHNIFDKWSLGFGIGLIQFHGDIMGNKDEVPVSSVQLSMPIANQMYGFQAEFIKGSISGQNLFSVLCDNPRHTIEGVPVQHPREGERFNMEFMEFDINLLIKLSVLFNEYIEQSRSVETGSALKDESYTLDLLCKVGVGLNMFRSLRQELATEQFIHSYGYEWMWQNDFENAGTKKNDNVTEGVFVLGIIAKYNTTKWLAIDFSATSRIGNTDKWDSKLNGNNDMFMFYSLGTTFTLGKH
ncbi:MAG: hypothetical protein VX762_03140 [Bacteroidota bacterium]|nr:hypothetical protein [Bacteroidota bacterium]